MGTRQDDLLRISDLGINIFLCCIPVDVVNWVPASFEFSDDCSNIVHHIVTLSLSSPLSFAAAAAQFH